jgi:EmrB/QacA subfamily drug resistance transporter
MSVSTLAAPAPARSGPRDARRAPSGPWPGAIVAFIGAFMAIMDAFIVNIALPSLRADLQATFAETQLIVAGYGLTYAAALITGSRLGDRFGRRRMFIIGLGGFTAASLACGLAPSPAALIGARLLQGLSAAVMFPQVLALLRATFIEPRERALAFAALGATQGLASIAGQIGGGVLVALDSWSLGWRAVFLVNVPVGLMAMIAAGRLIRESAASGAQLLDLAGALLNALALVLLLYPLIEGREAGWPAWSLVMLALALPALALFVRHQHHKSRAGSSPLMDIRLFRNRPFAVGIAALFAMCTALFSFFVLLTFLLQAGLGCSPLVAALVFLPLALAYVASAFVAGRVPPRRSRALMLIGGCGLTLGYAAPAALVGLRGSSLDPVILIPVLALIGTSQGFLFTPLINAALTHVPERDIGIASGLLSTMQQTGGALGVAAVGLIFFPSLQALEAAGASSALAYSSAFATALLYNIAAAAVTTLLLVFMQRMTQKG